MHTTNNDEHFRGLWFRAKSEPSLATLTPELVKCWARAKGLDVQQVEERDVGAFSPIPCIVLTLPNAKACFPKVRSEGEQGWVNRRRFADSEAVHWRKMDWFVPLWVPRGKLNDLLREVANASPQRSIELFDYHTSTLYNLAFEAVCIARVLPRFYGHFKEAR